MRRLVLTTLLFLTAQAALAQQAYPPPYPAGMRVVVGGQGALARNTPSMAGLCGEPPHPCTTADAVLPGVYGVVQADAPVLDPGGFYWLRVTYDSQVTGWSSAYPPFVNMMVPPQMVAGSSFRIVGDYLNGPPLTAGRCLYDGLQVPATLSLQPSGANVTGTILCDQWVKPVVGNHIGVIQAVNLGEGGVTQTTPSTEFQFVVSESPKPLPPLAPSNLRIAPVNTAPTNLRVVPTPTPESIKK